MTARASVRRALPVTFCVYVLQAGLAAAAALPASVALSEALGAFPADASELAAMLERLPGAAAALEESARPALVAIGILLLVGPWLQMSWLHVLAGRASPRAALVLGGKQLPRAWLVSLLVALGATLAALPSVGLASLLHRLLADQPDARRHDLAVAAALVPLVPLALLAHVWHDLARAAVLGPGRGTFRRCLRALRVAFDRRCWRRALGASLAGHGLVLGAELTASQLRLLPLGAALATLALQGALLARLVLRSAWLAHALACVGAEPGPGPADPSSEDEA